MTRRDKITSLFTSFAGQQAMLVIPRQYITFCQGDVVAALLLSQILYWADRTTDPDGWIAKSYAEWHDELGLSEYQIKRAVKGDKRSKTTFALENAGVETKLAKSRFHNGAATLHYRINEDTLRRAVAEFLAVPNNVQNDPLTMSKTSSEQCAERIYTETTAENTTETEKITDTPAAVGAQPSGEDSANTEPSAVQEAKPEKPPTPHQAMFEAVCNALGYKISTLTKTRKKEIGRVASELVEAGAKPEHVRKFWTWLKDKAKAEEWKTVTVNAMTKYWPDFEKTLRPPTYLFVPVPEWRRRLEANPVTRTVQS